MTLFQPNNSVKIDATVTSSSAGIGGGSGVRIQNTGNVTVYLKFGKSDVVATASDMPVVTGAGPEMIGKPQGSTHVAAITSTGSASITLTFGEGE